MQNSYQTNDNNQCQSIVDLTHTTIVRICFNVDFPRLNNPTVRSRSDPIGILAKESDNFQRIPTGSYRACSICVTMTIAAACNYRITLEERELNQNCWN